MRTARILFFAAALLLLFSAQSRLAPEAAPSGERSAHAAPARAPYDINIPILGYHKIDWSAPTQWYVTVDEFTRQMDVLKYYGYQTISLDDYLDYVAGEGQPPEKPIILTFDDGFEGVYDFAAPILRARNMTATLFMITSKLAENETERSSNEWQPAEPPAFHMTWPETVELYHQGFSIESHTVSHTSFQYLSPAQQTNELQQSRASLQARLPGNPVNFFAYPYGYGSQDPDVRARVQSTGYQAAVGFPDLPPRALANPSVTALTNNHYELPRMEIKSSHTLDLNETNPFWFFMRQVDPGFPLPNATLTPGLVVKDANNFTRSAFYAGETVRMAVQHSNYGDLVPAVASLQVRSPQELVYDSHATTPSQDVYTPTLKVGWRYNTFNYTLQAPQVDTQRSFSYISSLWDPSYLIHYQTFPEASAFTVQPYPLSAQMSPNPLDLQAGQERDVTFTVNHTEANAGAMYLTVSYSPSLEVVQSSPAGKWLYYPIGWLVKRNDCNSPCFNTIYPIHEAKEDPYGTGQKSYTLRMRLKPGISGPHWIRYRVTIAAPGNLTQTGQLRGPLNGSLDQQDYPSYFAPLGDHLYLPLVSR